MTEFKQGSILIDGYSLSRCFFGLFRKTDGARLQNQYETDVYARLNQIAQTETGRAVFKALKQAWAVKHKFVRVLPYDEDDEDNAVAVPVSGPESRDAAPKGAKYYLGGADYVKSPEDERMMKSLYEGTGLGSNVELYYNPHRLGKPEADTCPRDGRKWSGGCPAYEGAHHDKDDQLLHELIHAVRETRGEFNQVPSWNKDWMNEEEFFAVVITNIYLSERGVKNLRGNYLGMGVLRPPLDTSEGFLGKGADPSRDQMEHRRMLSRLCTESWALCQDISAKVLTAQFNPIREYMRNTKLYPIKPA
jgi:hypothetical protein